MLNVGLEEDGGEGVAALFEAVAEAGGIVGGGLSVNAGLDVGHASAHFEDVIVTRGVVFAGGDEFVGVACPEPVSLGRSVGVSGYLDGNLLSVIGLFTT